MSAEGESEDTGDIIPVKETFIRATMVTLHHFTPKSIRYNT